MYMNFCLHTHVCAPCACLVPWIPGTELQTVASCHWCWELNWGTLEQSVLLTAATNYIFLIQKTKKVISKEIHHHHHNNNNNKNILMELITTYQTAHFKWSRFWKQGRFPSFYFPCARRSAPEAPELVLGNCELVSSTAGAPSTAGPSLQPQSLKAQLVLHVPDFK